MHPRQLDFICSHKGCYNIFTVPEGWVRAADISKDDTKPVLELLIQCPKCKLFIIITGQVPKDLKEKLFKSYTEMKHEFESG